jgi:predicted alpha/beta-hydrolase family hydrolase
MALEALRQRRVKPGCANFALIRLKRPSLSATSPNLRRASTQFSEKSSKISGRHSKIATWMSATKDLRFTVEGAGEVSGLLLCPPKPRWLLALAHGAGAGMTHPFLEALADELARAGVATFRYQFPYMERRSRRPDSPAVLTATVAAAVQAAKKAAPGLPLLAGGKSMGGRMTSQAAAQVPLDGVRGLVFFGFPLHPPNQPGTKRAGHLTDVKVPMLFLQGTRDQFADLNLLRPICAKFGAQATLHVIDTADHSFHVLKKSSGRTDADVLRELAETTASWAERM